MDVSTRTFRLTALAVVVLLLSSSCASVPSQLPETMKQACALYQSVRPDVVKAREYAKTNWNFIPPDIQQTLLKIDKYLPELDKAGVTICAASAAFPGARVAPKVNWDEVLSTVVKAASFAADLKHQGVI